MLKTSEGIIIKTLKYGESSMILDIFSKDQGIKSYIIGGVTKGKSRQKAGRIRILNLVKYVAYEKDNDKLSRIKEIDYNYIYKSIPFDVIKGSIATFLIEVCRKSIRASDSYQEIYNHIVKGMIHLDNLESGVGHFHIRFLIDLASQLGFQMTNNYDEIHAYFDLAEGAYRSRIIDHRYTLDKKLSHYLYRYISHEPNIAIDKESRLNLLDQIVKYYQYHVPDFGELRSLPILRTLFN